MVRAARDVGDRGAHACRPTFSDPDFELAVMAEDAAGDLLRVVDREMHRRSSSPRVADLAAGLGVERRAVEHDHAVVAAAELVDRLAVLVQRQHLRLSASSVSS